MDSNKDSFKNRISPGKADNREAGKINTSLTRQLSKGEKEQEEISREAKSLPKLRLSLEELVKYKSRLLIFNLIEGTLAYSDVRIKVVIDDIVFPVFLLVKVESQYT